MPTQVDYAIDAINKLSEITRKSWGPMYSIRPEREAEVQQARLDMQTELNGIDESTLPPEEFVRLRRAHELMLVRTNPEFEMQRRMAGGREF